jgi:hypothetical protein
VVYVGLVIDVVGGSSKRSCFDSRRIPVVIKVEGDDDIDDLPIQHRIYIHRRPAPALNSSSHGMICIAIDSNAFASWMHRDCLWLPMDSSTLLQTKISGIII